MKVKLKNIIVFILWFDVFLFILRGFIPSLPGAEEVFFYMMIVILSIPAFFLQRNWYKIMATIIICFSLFFAYSSYQQAAKFEKMLKDNQSAIAHTQNDSNHFQGLNGK